MPRLAPRRSRAAPQRASRATRLSSACRDRRAPAAMAGTVSSPRSSITAPGPATSSKSCPGWTSICGAPRQRERRRSWTVLSRHDDPAAQQGARGAAKLTEQLGLGSASIWRVAAEPLVMVARDQQSLVGRGSGNEPRDEFQGLTQARLGIGRSRVAKDAGAGTAGARDALDELRRLLDPT